MLQRKPQARFALRDEADPVALTLPDEFRLHHRLPYLRLLVPFPAIRMAQHKFDIILHAIP